MRTTRTQQEFIKRYEPVHADFERFCRARVYGEMESGDLINETLLVAFQKQSELKNEKAFLSFLIGIAIRILSNAHRKRHTVKMEEHHEASAMANGPATDSKAAIAQLHKALASLPAEQKECLILFELSGFSIKEICKMQGAKESAVKQRLRRGRLSLRELLTDSVAEEEQAYNG